MKLCYNFDPYKHNGYRRFFEKNRFESFKKIKYEGLNIEISTTYYIVYEIDIKLVRKLKLLKINQEIKTNSNFDKISQLFDGSVPYEYNNVGPSWGSGLYYYSESENGISSQYEKRSDYNNRANIHSQKLKNYENKARFRK